MNELSSPKLSPDEDKNSMISPKSNSGIGSLQKTNSH